MAAFATIGYHRLKLCGVSSWIKNVRRIITKAKTELGAKTKCVIGVTTADGVYLLCVGFRNSYLIGVISAGIEVISE